MSEAEPKMTREEYIKATGISGDKLVDDVDKAHYMAIAGDKDRTVALNAKKAGKVIVESVLGLDHGFGYGPGHAALDDIRRKDRNELSKAEEVLLGNYYRKGPTATYNEDEVKEWSDASYRDVLYQGQFTPDTSLTGFIGRAIDRETGKFPDEGNIEDEVDHLAFHYKKANERADKDEDEAGEKYEHKKTAQKKAKELMSKFE